VNWKLSGKGTGIIILRPVRPTWGSFAQLEKAEPDFMAEREDVVSDEGRFDL
jgi:antitoxin VapB